MLGHIISSHCVRVSGCDQNAFTFNKFEQLLPPSVGSGACGEGHMPIHVAQTSALREQSQWSACFLEEAEVAKPG